MRAWICVLLLSLSFAAPLRADEKEWRALDEAALSEATSGRLDQALKTAEAAVAVARREFGNEDRRTANSLSLLGEILMAHEQWPQAEAKLRESWAIRERVLKPGDPDLEQSYNLLGRALAGQGRFDEAEKFHLKALAAAEKAAKAGQIGPQAPRWADMIATLDLLSGFYAKREDQTKARAMRKRAVDSLERYAGKDKKDHLLRVEELAVTAIDAGDYADAETIMREHVRLTQRYLGKKGDVATSLHNLGLRFRSRYQFTHAEPLFKRSLAMREKAHGPLHLDVARSLDDLAELYGAQGQYVQAEPLYERALAIREKALGPNHPDVATSLHHLAGLHYTQYTQEHYAKAEPLYRRSLAIRQKALEPNHPDLAASMHDLAEVSVMQGEYAQAESLHKLSLAIREKALGPDHADVATSLKNLAWVYTVQDQYAQAEPLYKRSLVIREKVLSPDDPGVAWSLYDLAEMYLRQARYAQAEPLFVRALAIWEKAFGNDDPAVAPSLESLAKIYRKTGRDKDAEKFEKRAAAIRAANR